MKNILIVALLLAFAAGGYWAGQKSSATRAGGESSAKVDAPGTLATTSGAKKLLYYRNPMGLPDTSPVPKKDSMGMDYIPVYEGEDDTTGSIKISTAKVQKLGVRIEPVVRRDLAQVVRAVGRVEIDERRIHAVAPKFEGWIERLHVNTTGQVVGRGQPLFEVYSPDLVSVQREYQVAARGVARLSGAGPESVASMRQLAEASLTRLRNWDVSEEQIRALADGGEPRRTLTFRSPAGGVVLEKKALQGQRFMPGESLYQIADVSSVWVLADVFERDIAAVKVGMAVTVKLDAYPDRTFEGKVSYLYPTLNAQTRTIPVRIELPNPGGLLRPAMYANVHAKVDAGRTVLVVPVSAVIDSGNEQRVLIQKEEGHFEPRRVKIGTRSDDYVEVTDGVRAGELVVVAANFLIDSESNLKAALGGMQEPKKTAVSHQAMGTLDSIESDGSVTMVMITHEPVASLNWPKMTMGFVPANPALVAKLKPGTPIHFEFVERKPGEWVITKIEKH